MEPRPRILVIEDELAIARLVERVLKEEGYDVQRQVSGRAGLAAALTDRPDAVILDLGLPDLDGMAVCRELRKAGLRMPIIMLTARDAVPDRVGGLDAGADDYLTKPFAFEELLARLRANLRRLTEVPDRLQVGDLALEPATRRVVVADREVDLTDLEFRLLEFLMRHPGQVMGRDAILDGVWGYAAAPTSNVVDIYIHYLRDKIDRGRERGLIRTVRGAGYVLST